VPVSGVIKASNMPPWAVVTADRTCQRQRLVSTGEQCPRLRLSRTNAEHVERKPGSVPSPLQQDIERTASESWENATALVSRRVEFGSDSRAIRLTGRRQFVNVAGIEDCKSPRMLLSPPSSLRHLTPNSNAGGRRLWQGFAIASWPLQSTRREDLK